VTGDRHAVVSWASTSEASRKSGHGAIPHAGTGTSDRKRLGDTCCRAHRSRKRLSSSFPAAERLTAGPAHHAIFPRYLVYPPARCYHQRIVRMNDASRPSRLRSALAMAAIATALAMLLGLAALCGPLRSARSAANPPQLSLTTLRSELAVTVDHPYLGNRPSKPCQKVFAFAVLPQSPASAVAMQGVVVAVVAILGWLASRVVPAGRDPPRGLAAALTGQDLLTRFCLARR
jgi:hypothetical protein